MFKFTDQLSGSARRTSEKYNRTARWNILYQFPKINVSILQCKTCYLSLLLFNLLCYRKWKKLQDFNQEHIIKFIEGK